VNDLSISSICLNSQFATTRLLITEKPADLHVLPQNLKRKGQGGLRTRGYYKTNYPEKPLITVITVVFNGKQHLKETISSVINLAYDNIEYIIVDAASTDGTIDLLKDYDDCIDYWVSEPDSGLYDAMNKAWTIIHPDSAVLFLGAGDKILKLPADCAGLRNLQVIYGQVQLGPSKIFKSRVNWQLKFANTLHHQALLIPKGLHIPPPFDTTYKVYADFDFNLRLLKQGVEFRYDNDFLAYAMPGGASEIYSKEAYKIAQKNFGLFFGILAYLFYRYQGFKGLTT
jgi:glycosyltransferase involved in cell wall biosynthesis